jgi:pyruvate/2-oxoglutarate dehydrogenase complex dihydrolipoamide acyltransferase (E2) component
VTKGDVVPAGARIGAIGTSGRPSSAEPHLHFGVRLAAAHDHYVDPLSLLPPLPGATSAPAAPVPVPAPLRTEPQPVPVAAPAPSARRVRAAPRAVPARLRPRGALHPGPVVVPAPVMPDTTRTRPVLQPRPVPAGPAPLRPPAASPAPVPAAPRVSDPAPRTGHGRGLVLGGLAAIALALFGGVAWRALARAHTEVNGAADAAATGIRDRIRIPPAVRRLLRSV